MWNSTVSSPGKPSSQQWIIKKAERCIYHCCVVSDCMAVEFTQVFLAGFINNTTKLFTPIIKSFVALQVLIQNERTQWFMVRTLRSAFVQGTVRVGYSPYFPLL